MGEVFRGRAWVFGDDVSTDHIISGKYKFASISSLEDMLPHVFEEVVPGFPERFRPSDVIVAGRNFGMGSSREHAPLLLKMLGARILIAETFARIFYRNSVNLGLLPLEIPGFREGTRTGDIIEVDLDKGTARNLTRGFSRRFKPPPGLLMEIIRAGGLIGFIEARGGL